MPCISCGNIFNKLPCQTPFCTLDNMPTKVVRYFLGVSIKRLKRLFVSLNLECPCKDCIVNVICQKRCEKYKIASNRI